MNRVFEFVRSLALLVGYYVVFGLLGQATAIGFISLAQDATSISLIMYVASAAAAFAALAWTAWWCRTGHALNPATRFSLAAFVAFSCWQWTIVAPPDWNPIPIVVGTVACWGSALVLLRISRPAVLSN